MIICYLGIGSNLGERRKNIKEAVKKINSLRATKVLKISRIIQSKSVGGPRRQPEFLNAALKVRTKLSPSALLTGLKTIEKEMGRKKTVRFGPRIIDLDILLYGDKVIERNNLVIPHPRIFERDFVLKPLLEII
ncbi:MAG: 2-amino-4-hydroxy-6-hydroxymethyldihydropteridine diphosphokinase [Candidatus Omnitrophota bacterium]|nr:2-amino-4-hydroxy-6-hydroxymethyldihydropteridine diphosphokinase [Candidatus Omnitrophota bacterium]